MRDWTPDIPTHPTGWVGFDLDGTIAVYDIGRGMTHIGEPIPAMISVLHRELAKGEEVRIMTARACLKNTPEWPAIQEAFDTWCEQHIGRKLPITNEKDFGMKRLYDDRAISVEENTGKILRIGYRF